MGATMTPERLRQIEGLYHLAREREPGAREDFLAEACRNDEELLREVTSLLAEDSGGPLSITVLHAAAGLFGDFGVGTQFGPYEIVGRLGEGGMGTVYRARDTRLGRWVAVKTAHDEFSGRFQREARAISALNHPNICTLYDIGANYLVMELIEGQTLAHRLEKGRLHVDLVLRYGSQIAHALSAAHSQGLIHRDLKPANIMITKNGIKVLDFGLAKFSRLAEGPETLTDSQTIVGTPSYMAPEQLEGKECDARTDIFALGLVLFEMTTGKKPFSGDSRAALIADIMRCEPAVDELSPPPFAHIVERCLARDPDDRWQTARDVKLELEYQGRAQTPAAPRKRGRRWMTAAATILGVAVLAGVWYFGRGGGEPRVTPLTTDLGLQSWPSFSPDGTRVAYSWNGSSADNFDIWVRQIGPGVPTRLTKDPAWDVAPQWSPDGKWIAFSRRQAHGTGVWAIPALGGAEIKLAETEVEVSLQDFYPNLANGLDWSPDTRWLAFAKRATNGQSLGLALVSFETREIKQLTAPNAEDDFYPKFAPDGHAIAFKRAPGEQGLMLLSLSRSGEAKGGPKQIPLATNQVTRDFSWSADSRDLIVSLGGVEASNLWRIPVSGGIARLLPFVPPGAAFPAVAHRGERMLFSREQWDRNIWSLELDPSGRRVGSAVRVFDSTASEYSPQFSPDGARVVFQSHRSGTGVQAIFTCFSDGSNCAQLSPAGGPHSGSPSWSPDSQWIAYDTFGPKGYDICVISAAGGKPRLVVQAAQGHSASMPRWSANGQWLYYQYTSGQIWRIRESGGEPQPVVRAEAYSAAESPDGKWLYYSGAPNAEPTSLRKIPVEGGPSTEVLPRVAGRNWVVLDTGIWFLTPSSLEGSLLQFYDFASKSTRTVYRTARPVFVGLTVAPDHRRVLFTQIDAPTSRNLMLVENFR
jgi:serine/threonine protein kinase